MGDFDPDKYLSEKKSGSFDPDAYLSTGPSATESALRGAAQGATFNLSDELAGAHAAGPKIAPAGMIGRTVIGAGKVPPPSCKVSDHGQCTKSISIMWPSHSLPSLLEFLLGHPQGTTHHEYRGLLQGHASVTVRYAGDRDAPSASDSSSSARGRSGPTSPCPSGTPCPSSSLRRHQVCGKDVT